MIEPTVAPILPTEPMEKEAEALPMGPIGPPPLEGDALDQKAFRYHAALGDDSPGYEKLKTEIASGADSPYKDVLVAKEMSGRAEAGRQLVMDNVIAGTNADPQLIAQLAQPGEPPNPETIVEETYTKRVMEAIMAAEDNDAVVQALDENPLGFDEKYKVYEDVIFKNMIVNKHLEETNQAIKNMSWGSYLYGTAQQLVGVPSWLNIIRNKGDVPETSAWTTPGALEERVAFIRNLPPGEMDMAIRAEIEGLMEVNPLDAQTFIQAMQSYALSDQALSAVGDLSMLPIGTALKGGKIAGKAAAEAVTGSKSTEAAAKGIIDAGKVDPKLANVPKVLTPEEKGFEDLFGRGAQGSASSPVLKEIEDFEAIFGKGSAALPVTPQPPPGKAKTTIKGADGRSYTIDGRVVDVPPLKPAAEAELEAIAKAASAPHITVDTALAGTGKIEAATKEAVTTRVSQDAGLAEARRTLSEQVGGKAPVALKRELARAMEKMPTMFSTRVKANPGELAHNLRSIAIEDIMTAQRLFGDAAGIRRVSRLPEEVLAKAFDQAEEFFVTRYNLGEDTVMDIARILPNDTPFNVGFTEYTIGKTGSLPYNTLKEAYKDLKRRGFNPRNAAVVNQGDKYVIKAYTEVGEDKVDDLVLTPENKPMNDSWSMMKGWLGSRMQTSEFQSTQRNTAVLAEQALGSIIREVHAPYEALSKRSRIALDKVMRANQVTEKIPGDPATRGAFYDSSADLSRGFMRHVGRIPTKEEEAAYWAVVRANHMDYTFRVFEEFRRKAVQGFKTVKVRRLVKEKEWATNTFEGREVDLSDIPWESGHNIDIAFIDEKGMVNLLNLKDVSAQTRKTLQEGFYAGGYRAIQAWDPRTSGIMKTTGVDYPVPFLLTKDVTIDPLNLGRQVNFRPGFHNEYKGEWFLKQARVAKGRFEGDSTALAFRTQAEAKKYGPMMEKARQFLAKKDEAGLVKYLSDSGLPFDVKQFKKIFEEHLDVNVPFAITKRSTTSIKNTKDTLLNGKSFQEEFGQVDNSLDDFYNPSAQYGDPYTNKRDPLLWEIRGGTEDVPALRLEAAEQISPMLAQTKAMGKMVRSDVYHDYQMTSIQNYVEEFGKDLVYNGVPVSPQQLRRNPAFYFENGTIATTNPTRKRQAEQLKAGIRQLVGEPSATAEMVDEIKQRLANSIYTNLGEKYVDKLIPERLLPFAKDPLSYLRSAAFHIKLGLFAPVQMMVQASSLVNVVAVSPVHGLASTPGNIAMGLLKMTDNPAMIDAAAEHVSKFPGWTKDKFIEAKRLMDEVDFSQVGGASSWRNDIGDPTITRTTAGKVAFDYGPIFFNMGEGAVKLAAWNTAYLEFAAKNPKKIGKMTEFDAQKIQDKASALATNMTRDANAFWQQGVAGSFTQFWSYNVRLAELIMGKQLTIGEKARLVGAMGLMWGAPPVAAGAYFLEEGDLGPLLSSFNPFSSDLFTYAAQQGVNIDGTTADAINRGMASVLVEAATGRQWDFASRYGPSAPQVLQQIKKNFSEVKEVSDVVPAIIESFLGPSGSVNGDMIKTLGPLTSDIFDFLSGNTAAGELIPGEMEAVLRGLSSANFLTKLYTAWTGDTLRSLKGNIMAQDEDPYIESLRLVLGVQTLDEKRAYDLMEAMRSEDIDIQKIVEHLKPLSLKMWDAKERDDMESYRRYRNALIALSDPLRLSVDQRSALIWPDRGKQRPVQDMVLEEWAKNPANPDVQNRREELIQEWNNE